MHISMGSAGPWSLKEMRKSQNVKARRGLGSDLIQAFYLQKRKLRPTEGGNLRMQRKKPWVRPGALTVPGFYVSFFISSFLPSFLSLSSPFPPPSFSCFLLSSSLPPSSPSLFQHAHCVQPSDKGQSFPAGYLQTLWRLGTL